MNKEPEIKENMTEDEEIEFLAHLLVDIFLEQKHEQLIRESKEEKIRNIL